MSQRTELYREITENAARSDSLLRELHSEHSSLLEFVRGNEAICAQEQDGDSSLTAVVIRYIKSLEKKIADRAEEDAEPLHCDMCGAWCDNPWHGSGIYKGKEYRHLHACDECRSKLPSAGHKYVWFDTMDGFSNSWDVMFLNGPLSLESYMESIAQNPEKKSFKLIEYRCLTDDTFEFMNQMKLR